MKAILLIGFLALALLLAPMVPTSTGPYEDGFAAYERNDYATALKFWRPLAEQGDAEAQFSLGGMYADGRGVSQDNAKAMIWRRKAAEQGHAAAQALLGGLYDHGLGVSEDDVEAAKWYRLAAEQGDAEAQSNLGNMYVNGEGVPQDYVLAHLWFNLAAAQGGESARENRDIAAKRMTPDQFAEAQRMAREWMAKHQQ